MRNWTRDGVKYRTAASWARLGVPLHRTSVPAGPPGETKAAGTDWDEREHPRDRKGRFVRKNARVRLVNGALGTVTGFNSRSGRFQVRRDADGRTVQVFPAHMTVVDDQPAAKPSPAPSGAVSGGPTPGPSPSPPSGGVNAARPDLTAGQRNIINSLNLDDEAEGYPAPVRVAAMQIRDKLPLTANQAEALAKALWEHAAHPGVPKQRVKALNDAAWRLQGLGADLGGIIGLHVPDDAVKAKPADLNPGDQAALPGLGGSADIRTIVEAKPWYGRYRITVEDHHGNTETRYLSPDTTVYRYDGPTPNTDKNTLIKNDKALPKGAAPVALYTSGSGGPGGVAPDQQWYDVLAKAGADSDPIPVVNLAIQGALVNGFAFRRGGRSYLVEPKPGESRADAVKRAVDGSTMLEQVLGVAPGDTKQMVRGLALLQQKNPHDSHWEKQYGIAGFESEATGGFGGITMWNGHPPKPGMLAHEFGHNLDYHLHGPNQGVSGASGPVIPGQTMSWADAVKADERSSSFYKNRFTETRPGNHPVTPGAGGVTEYGQSSPAEDFAESVRLWMKDRREGKIGYDPKSIPPGGGTGDNVRFADLYPERARILNAAFGVDPAPPSTAHAARRNELLQVFDNVLKASGDDKAPPGPAYSNGLTADEVDELWLEARERRAAADAEWAAIAKAKQEAEEKKQKAKQVAAEKVATVKEALEKGLLPDADAAKIKKQVAAFRKKKMTEGVTGDSLAAAVAAHETQLITRHFGLGSDFRFQPWLSARVAPGINEETRAKAHEWLLEAGTTVHPLAEKQYGAREQAKANICAELASRLNNPADWSAFSRSYLKQDRGDTVGPYDSYTQSERQTILAQEVALRLSAWAVDSGDSDGDSVMMQVAVNEEFGIDAPPAPGASEYWFDQLMEDRWADDASWYRRVSRVMYEHTQEEFAKAGITEISVWRGMSFEYAPDWAKLGVGQVEFQPINSWATTRDMAEEFTQAHPDKWMFAAKVPVELVLGTARTGFGCLVEYEFVVFDNVGEVLMERP